AVPGQRADAVLRADAQALQHPHQPAGTPFGVGVAVAVDDSFLRAKPVIARFYAGHLLGQVEGFRASMVDGAAAVMDFDEVHL
ncbi:hypothetical protein, partial [Azospirillum sp. TSO22-1]|uniref:hypothetical protein n=1 Tax=Azospirillum sp. TSO22-1 TaxID=716789 RepID=UPI000D611121